MTEFTSVPGSSAELTDTGLKAIAEKCHKLEEFKLKEKDRYAKHHRSSNNGITEVGIAELIHANKNLKILSLHYLDNLSDNWIHLIATGCPQLEVLDIEPELEHNRISDSAIEELIRNCGQLKVLALCNVERNSGAPWKTLSIY